MRRELAGGVLDAWSRQTRHQSGSIPYPTTTTVLYANAVGEKA